MAAFLSKQTTQNVTGFIALLQEISIHYTTCVV